MIIILLYFIFKRERGDEMQAINKLFTPEFRNRLDAIIPFAPLSEPVIGKVVDKFLLQLEHQLLDKKVEAEFTPQMGTSSVKGFAWTLMIGIIVSIFTAVVVTNFYLGLLSTNSKFAKPGNFGIRASYRFHHLLLLLKRLSRLIKEADTK